MRSETKLVKTASRSALAGGGEWRAGQVAGRLWEWRHVSSHSGPLAYFRGTWNFEAAGSNRADPRRIKILTMSDLPLVHNDSAGAQKRPVT